MSEYSPEHHQSPEGDTPKSVFVETIDGHRLGRELDRAFDHYYGKDQWELRMHAADEAELAIRTEANRILREAQNLEWAGFGHVDVDGNDIPKDFGRGREHFDPKFDLYVTEQGKKYADELRENG